MRIKLLINLLMTLVISFIGTGLAFCIWYNSAKMGFEEQQGTAILFAFLTIGQNIGITLFTLPILFQINTSNYLSSWTKTAYLFIAPILITLLFLVYYFNNIDRMIVFAVFIAPAIFCLVNVCFYRQMTKKYKKELTIGGL
jgi:phosphoglycerol transferase MdoB-like AlkP superfamily enzyme